jgi:glycosyltransferase involved in cell wall biosynthesis
VDDVVKNMKVKNLLADLISCGAKVTLAIEKSEGDVICFLDDDDMYSPWRLGLRNSSIAVKKRVCK